MREAFFALWIGITGSALLFGLAYGLCEKTDGSTSACHEPWRRIEYINPSFRIGCQLGYAAHWIFSVPK